MCVIEGHTTIGRDNRIFQFGSHRRVPTRTRSTRASPRELVIGDRNTIREFVHPAHRHGAGQGGVTRIGNDNWIMAYTHIAHDCVVGNNTTHGQQHHAGRPRASWATG